ncbi:unnamed protein product [Lymnaea stagnalis]|uniref:Uncharacterized protein n=1 Tax=Lymnaea stagnalis TaxID=6523 RepID=A0AAV2H7G0_LYMST
MANKKRQLKDPRTLRLFFSSPFGGMEEEREELTRKYFPQFQHLCNTRGIQFVPVDMRWGITSEAADNAQVINICLREIDRSDVFIGFFGQRYGWHGESDELLQRNFDNAVGRYPWLADVRGKSVTELEFLHGHLNHPGELPSSISFRDKEYDDYMKRKSEAAGDLKSVFKYSAESELSSSLMRELMGRVKETEFHCLGVLFDYKNPKKGAKFMFESVWQCCKDLIAASDNTDLSPLEQSRLCHNTFMTFRTSLYYGEHINTDELKPLKLKDHPKVLVKGPAGCGKSALLANLIKTYKESKTDTHLVYHFVGCAQGTTEPKNILKRILSELQYINGSQSKENDVDNEDATVGNKLSSNDFHDIYLSVKNEMEHASSDGKNVLIIIDGLEKVKSSVKTAKHLYWLPESFPAGISLIVSTKESDLSTIDLLVTQRQFYVLEIYPLQQEVIETICKETLMINGKELSPHQLQRIVEAEQTRNPLFLKIVLSEISIYGYFRMLDKKIDSLIYSDGVKDLLSKVLQRFEEDYNGKDSPNLVAKVLSALAVSHSGLSETELIEIFDLSSSCWSPFYFAMENFFIIHEGLLRFAFSALQQAVTERYLQTEEQCSDVIENLINYFEKIRQSIIMTPTNLSSKAIRRVAEELPYLQKKIEDKQGLAITLSDMGVFQILQKKSVYELIDLWGTTGYNQEKIYNSLISSFDLSVNLLYLYQDQNNVTEMEPPGFLLLPCINSMADMFGIANYYRAHVKVLQRAIKILEGIKDKVPEDVRLTMLRDNRYYLACAYVDNTEYDKAQPLHESVMIECRNLLQNAFDKRTKLTLAKACNGLGVLHIRQKHYQEAEPLFQESIELHKELGNDLSVAEAIQNLGVIKLDNGEPETALHYFNKAMETFEAIYFGHLPVQVGNLLTNMGLCYRRMNDIDKAENMYQRSLTVKAKAVGLNHEVIATCYTNLGSLEFYRKNYPKAEEYTRKAIEILELNEVKPEQNEMWQAKENLVLNLICQNKWDEALPIFQDVFAVLQKEKLVDQGAASVHREIIRYMIHKGMFEEAANISRCHIYSAKLRQPNTYIWLDLCVKELEALSGISSTRPQEETVAYALDKLWPGNNELTAYIVQNYVIPTKDFDSLVTMVMKMDEMNPEFNWTSYKVGAEWCTKSDNLDVAELVLKTGLEKYPDSIELKTKLFDCYRVSKQYQEAYPYLKEVIANEPENQALLLVAGDVACKSGDVDLCLKLWEEVAKMPDENLAKMALDGIKCLTEALDNYRKEGEETEDTEQGTQSSEKENG